MTRASDTPTGAEGAPCRLWLFGDDVNTDDILPGKYAPFMVGEQRYPSYAFAHLRPSFAGEVRRGDILVGGRNWGLGSSREYAPRALRELGVGAIIAASFARIHYRNLINLGIPAFVADLRGRVADGDRVAFDPAAARLVRGRDSFALPPPPPFLREVLAEGSVLDFYRRHRRFPGEPPRS